MKIENEYPIQAISGKDSSTPEMVYLVRNGVQIKRIYTPPVLPPSDERNYVLSLTQVLRSTWFDLPNKSAWDEAASKTGSLTDHRIDYPLGMNLFLSSNFYRFLWNQSFDLEPPEDTSMPMVNISQIHISYDPVLNHTRVELRVIHDQPGGCYLYPRLSPSSSMPDRKWRLWEYKSLQRIGTAPSVYGPYTPSIYTMDGAPSGQILHPGNWCRLQIKTFSHAFIFGHSLTYGPLLVHSS